MEFEMGNAVVSGVASKVTESLFDTIKREISYVFKYQSYVNDLKNPVEDLRNRRERVKKDVDSARGQVDEIYQDVQDWLNRVDEFTREVVRSIEDENEAKKLCFKGLCPNVFRRYSLSKKALKATKDATDLLAKGIFSSVSYSPPPERMEFKHVVKEHQEFNSRMKVFQDVMEALEDPKVNMIGVYGPGGVGKTTLAKQVAKKVIEDKLIFDEVVMVELTQNPNLEKIQVKFACDLGLKFLPHQSEFDRVVKLRRRLKQKRVLVILDNIWKKLELEAIGIPFGDEEKEGEGTQRRCTVLLTSRDRHVLRNDMNSQKDFHINVLSDEEAKILFWKTMDGTMDGYSAETSSFQLLADEIVRKCEGLPVAITTIACALRHQPIMIWKKALDDLKKFAIRRIRGMETNVYSIIKLSYDYLDDKEAKSLFLLCALHGDGSQIPINDLMMYVMGSGWFTTFDSLEQLRTTGYALIHRLKSSSLLLDGDNEHVKMHDIIHDVGVSIAEEQLMFNFQNVGDLKEELERVIAKDPIAISLTCGEIQELPQRLECPKLKLFLFFSNHGSSSEIQNLFSEGIKELRVLNLARIDFSLSPPSFISLACLTNLRTLSLKNCRSLVDVALVGELKKLEILSFQGSDIERLPSEIGQLTRLKKLDLSNCSKLKVIAPTVISKLSRLEELYMVNSFTFWEKGEGGSNASLVELNRLSQLTTLEINIPDVKIVPQDLVSVDLERFKIFIGDEWDWIDEDSKGETSRMLKFSGLDKNIYLGKGMKMLLKNTEDLCVDKLNIEKIWVDQFAICQNLTKLEVKDCSHLKFLFSYSMVQSLVQLQNLVIKECESMEWVIKTNELRRDKEQMIKVMVFPKLNSLTLSDLPRLTRFISMIASDTDTQSFFDEKVAFPSLEILEIISVNELRKIWHHELDSDSFSKLKQLKVIYCDKLMNIFSSSIILGRRFQRLEKVIVDGCKLIKEIIEEETNSDRLVDEQFPIASTSTNATSRFQVFPQLTEMQLVCLPNLISFNRGVHVFEWPMLKYLMVYICEKVKILFGSSELLSRETEIQQSPLFLIDEYKVAFPNLKTLKVGYCHGLRSLMTLSIFRSLVNIERIKIVRCEMIKEIVQQIIKVKEDPIIFSQLVHLELDDLPRLEHFLGGNITLEFPNLEQVIVSECVRMKTFSQGVIRTPKLQKLQVTEKYSNVNEERWEGSLNSTIQKMFEMDGVCTLDRLILSQNSSMKEIWHDQILPVRFFGNLSSLVVDDCKLMSSAIPANLLRFLNKLRLLTVKNCDSVEEVFHMEETNANEHSVKLFPKLCLLHLIDLPKLKRFCNFSRSIIELPSLDSLAIKNCPNVETFISNSTNDQPLFNEKVTFHKLQWLKLSKLPKLLHLCKENSRSVNIFQSLRFLEISECSKLEQVVPSWVSFDNLTSMEVSKCDRLINLMALSTAKSLVLLKIMKVTDCKMIEEIIHVREEVKKDCVVFSQLKSLELSCLPSLTSFFLGHYTLEFPSLEQVIVKECPKMEIFSRGVLSTPKLERLQLTEIEDEWLCEGSLNATVQKLFEKTHV